MIYNLTKQKKNVTLLERLAAARDISTPLKKYLNPTYADKWVSGSKLPQAHAAYERIKKAIKHEEKIMIFGDYDVDGIISSYCLYRFFRSTLSYHNISIQLPHRKKDGYGIKKHHVQSIKDLGCSLIITVDNGITCVQEAEFCKELGIDLIITDHHHPLEEIPDAVALVNPQLDEEYPFKEIS